MASAFLVSVRRVQLTYKNNFVKMNFNKKYFNKMNIKRLSMYESICW